MYTDYHVVDFRDVDRNYNIKLSAMLQILSTAATKDFHYSGFDPMYLNRKNLAWVIYDAQIDMDVTKLYANTLKVETFVKCTKNVYCTRYYVIYDDNDNLIGTGMSKWVVVDTVKKSLAKIPNEIIAAYPFDEESLSKNHKLAMNKSKLKVKSESETKEKVFDIRYFDIDPNYHVNNTVYAAWAIESLSDEGDFLAKNVSKSINIIFKNECPYTQKQVKVKYQIEDKTTHHDIYTLDDNLLCIIDVKFDELKLQ